MNIKYAQVYWFDSTGKFINKVSSSLSDEAVRDLNIYGVIYNNNWDKLIDDFTALQGIQEKLNSKLTGVFMVEESSQYKLIKL